MIAKCEMENASMFPLAERRRQKFTLVLFLSFHPAVPPGMPSACHHAAQWHWANDVIISSHFSAGPLDPWACAEDTLVMMCGVQLWTWQNSLMPTCLRMPKCCKNIWEILMTDIWTAWKYSCYLGVLFVLTGLWEKVTSPSLWEMVSYLHPNREIKTKLMMYGWVKT